ncbi:MAG TPA: chaperone modulator CbpM, partial [Deltaproteobacteria bacterium]|nr:chaperone modulator CbpM [Deltaproteobacteria bacterium]
MEKDVWTVREVVEILNIDEEFIAALQREDIITLMRDDSRGGNLLRRQEIDKIRVAKVLVEDMDINLPGVEVILGMRQNMIDMRRQFDDILKDLADEIRRMF